MMKSIVEEKLVSFKSLEQKVFAGKLLEFPQIVIKKWLNLPKAPICQIFERFRMAVL